MIIKCPWINKHSCPILIPNAKTSFDLRKIKSNQKWLLIHKDPKNLQKWWIICNRQGKSYLRILIGWKRLSSVIETRMNKEKDKVNFGLHKISRIMDRNISKLKLKFRQGKLANLLWPFHAILEVSPIRFWVKTNRSWGFLMIFSWGN